MIIIGGATLAFFLGCLLLSKKKRQLPDHLLCCWIFVLSLHLIHYYLNVTQLIFQYPHLLGIGNPLPLVHGPFIYLYAAALMGKIEKWKPKYLLHFMPIALFYGYYARFYLLTANGKIEFVQHMSASPDVFYSFLFPAIVLSGATYIVLTIWMLRKHETNLLNSYANPGDSVNLHWLRNLVVGLLIIWLVIILGDVFISSAFKDPAIFTTAALFVGFLGYHGLKQGNIFVNMPVVETLTHLSEDEPQRYSKSGLKKEQVESIKSTLTEWMEIRKMFLEEDISLPQLAERIGVHPNYLSQVINEQFDRNFYEFINGYRVLEFKRLIAEGHHKNKTLYALALESGFSSKATFNNSFKKITGMTPSEYVRSLD